MENRSFSDLSVHAHEHDEKSKIIISDEGSRKSPEQRNINANEIDEETIDKLRGDAIGDTMYSQSSIIKILLQLSDVEWTEKLEEDLCFLWDMTVEKDVCKYLFQLSFPSIATTIILKYNEARLIEIIIGILGNICSNSEVVPDITDVEISIVLNALDTDDPLILIQIMRFIVAIVYHRNQLHFITSEIVDKICFILTNSTNKELLLQTMETLAKITTDFKLEQEFLNGNIANSTLIAYNFINEEQTGRCDEFDEETDEEMKSLNLFIQIVLNMCSYINEMNNNSLYKEISSKNDELVTEFRKITKKYTYKANLIPLSEDIRFYFDSFTIILPVLNIKYDRVIFINVLETITLLLKNEVNNINEFIELCRYMISVSDVNILVRDSEHINNCNNMFEVIYVHDSKCQFNFKEKLLLIINKLSKKIE